MSYTHLTEQERYVISHLKVAKFSLREIARRINRHHTTVSRELKRIKLQTNRGQGHSGGRSNLAPLMPSVKFQRRPDNEFY